MSSAKHADEHVYDGIRELDNPMPTWWVASWFVTIVFSYFYVVHMDNDGTGVLDEYKVAVNAQAARDAAAALALGEVSESSLAVLAKDPATMAQARTRFVSTCAVCHGERGEGVIGPNLTDNYWKNCDGDLVGVHHVIDVGVPTRGMPAWGKQLDPIELRKLAAFVGTLAGTNVEGGKAPE
ncbi:MAG: cbb3-type cytochrome c oxidase N-terminal domain-containing protein, partial [Myxococcota bacterium]